MAMALPVSRPPLRRFGQTGFQVPVIGQGTWQIDGRDDRTAIAALRKGIDLGLTHIDTAEMYGEAEPLVGEAIAGRRDEVFLVSKVLPGHASRRGTIAACERSLGRLRTNRLDCYLLHWRGGEPLAETIAAFETLRTQGKILSWGVSNFDVRDLEEALRIAGPGKIACNQVLYHLGERAIEHRVIPFCERESIAVVAYSPFGHGEFPDSRKASGRVLAEIARAHGMTARQIALSFLTRRQNVFAIPKASTITHVEENAGAALSLSDAELAAIDRAFPRGSCPDLLPML